MLKGGFASFFFDITQPFYDFCRLIQLELIN
jgi:hypothetical protein